MTANRWTDLRSRAMAEVAGALFGAAMLVGGCAGEDRTVVLDAAPAADVYVAGWATSAHANAAAAAFRRWDVADAVPRDCARCHAEAGFLDFIGADGSAAGRVDRAARPGSGIGCAACHAPAARALDSVEFPSGRVVRGLGREAICLQCHQGVASTDALDALVAATGADVAPASGLYFLDAHELPAGATLFGREAGVGYEYLGRTYRGRARHAPGAETCLDCHGAHSLAVQVGRCGACHEGVATRADLRAIRMAASRADYDGDGDAREGIAGEVDGLAARLLAALQTYAAAVSAPLARADDVYPYFFTDLDGDGRLDPAEATHANRYVAWTPRLLRAAYNYHYARKDPGAYAHNPKYVIELLYDALADLDARTAVPDLARLARDDGGHFDATSSSWRGRDDEAGIARPCARCHSPGGFQAYVSTGAEPTAAQPRADGLTCATCHTGDGYGPDAPRLAIGRVVFPGGASIASAVPSDALLCATCHAGRESGAVLLGSLAGLADDAVGPALAFRSPHRLTAAAIQEGAGARVGCEYPGKLYAGRDEHYESNPEGSLTGCTACHGGGHAFSVAASFALPPGEPRACTRCHSVGAVEEIGLHGMDYDGSGATTTTRAEVGAFVARLLGAMQEYAALHAEADPVAFSSEEPCFRGPDGRAYATWTPRLLRAAHNHELVRNDPGAWAHNRRYALELLYDSLESLSAIALDGGTTRRWTDGLTRP